MITNFFGRLGNVFWAFVFGLFSPLIFIICFNNEIDVLRLAFFGETYSARIISKEFETCTHSTGRRGRRSAHDYPCYTYNVILSPTHKTLIKRIGQDYNVGSSIKITRIEEDPTVFRMGKKEEEGFAYLKNSFEFWLTTIGLSVSGLVLYGIYLRFPSMLFRKNAKEIKRACIDYSLPILCFIWLVWYSVGWFGFSFSSLWLTLVSTYKEAGLDLQRGIWAVF